MLPVPNDSALSTRNAEKLPIGAGETSAKNKKCSRNN